MDSHVQKAIHSAAYQDLCRFLRDRRLELGLRQDDLADRLNIAQNAVSQIEQGQRRLDLTELAQVCEALELDLQTVIDVFRRALEADAQRTE